MNKTKLKNYAKLIADVGGNVQKGQEVRISADLDQPEFVKLVVEACYKRGASKVTVDWSYQPLTKVNTKYRSQKVMNRIEDWELARMNHNADVLPVSIYLTSEDPDGLKGVNQVKLARASKARYPLVKPIRDRMDNKYQWCIAGVPGAAWAKKVFPGIRTSLAIEKLWDAILTTSRANGEDPIAAWEEHNRILREKYDTLNSLHIKNLHYTASNGTDLTVGLISDGLFAGGGEYTLDGKFFNPNIPSEEVFTSPMKGEAEGVVHASKPLSYKGELIENFWFRFEGGKVVEIHAEKGQALLEEMIRMDENAAYLGECALVPYESPINQTGILFYNTLYDENAVCHLALGAGFTNCIQDYEKYTNEELHAKGINDSMIHVDFMIGTPDLSIVATTVDGKEIPIFQNGSWAI
jgi:aminopeptidase